jgi:hypothetical protein
MTPETFAEWFRQQGIRVVRTESSYWAQSGPRVFQAFPYHWLICPDEDEIEQFLRQQRAAALRYSTPDTAPRGMASYHAVYDQPQYGFESLGHWARKNTRRGLHNCRIEPVSLQVIAEAGWSLQVDTLHRQGRAVKLDRNAWRRMCCSAAGLPGFESWGAFVENQLAASVIVFQMEDTAYLLYQQCLRDYLPLHVNNALAFTVTRDLINRPGIRAILYGLHSLDASPSVDEFKFRMGYQARLVRQRVVFHPKLEPFANPASVAVLRQARRFFPASAALAKAEGMLRFYLQGLRPLAEQDWPEPIKLLHNPHAVS